MSALTVIAGIKMARREGMATTAMFAAMLMFAIIERAMRREQRYGRHQSHDVCCQLAMLMLSRRHAPRARHAMPVCCRAWQDSHYFSAPCNGYIIFIIIFCHLHMLLLLIIATAICHYAITRARHFAAIAAAFFRYTRATFFLYAAATRCCHCHAMPLPPLICLLMLIMPARYADV